MKHNDRRYEWDKVRVDKRERAGKMEWQKERAAAAHKQEGENQQVNSNVIAIRSIWSWSEIPACDDKYWFDKTTEAEIWADMNTGRVEESGLELRWVTLCTHFENMNMKPRLVGAAKTPMGSTPTLEMAQKWKQI